VRVALVLLVLAGPCRADPWIDYDLLLEQNAEKVVVSTDASGSVTRSLDLGDGVTVSCSDQGCVGMDQTGAVGCVWSIYSELLAVAEVCEIPAERTESVSAHFGLLTAFVARNALPPRSVAEIEAVHQGQINLYRNGIGGGPLDCGEATRPDSDVMLMLDGLSDQVSAGTVADEDEAFDPEAFLATPRLPVMNPCL
jgi:hypothetical protein